MSIVDLKDRKLVPSKLLEKDPRAEVFNKLWKENELLKLKTFKEFTMCLGTTILQMSAIKATFHADVSHNFKKAITKNPLPPDRYIMTYILLRNLANEIVTLDELLDALINHRGEDFSEGQLRNIMRYLCDEKEGVIKKHKGLINRLTGEKDRRTIYFVFKSEYLKDWIQVQMLVFGMNRVDLNDYTEGAWSTTENDWLFKHIGWQNTDPDEYDEVMRDFIKAVRKR